MVFSFFCTIHSQEALNPMLFEQKPGSSYSKNHFTSIKVTVQS